MTSDNSSPRAQENTNPHEPSTATSDDSRVVKTVEHELLTEGMHPERANRLAERVVTVAMQRHSGPLPTVKDFAGYEQACPGAARVILDMAVNQQKHLHWIEKSAVVLQCFGQVTAIAIISITLLAAYYFSDRHVWLAGLVLMGSVSGLVTILWPRRNNGESGGVASAEPEKKSNPAKRKTWK